MNEIDHTWWYLCRSAGLVAYLLMFASVALGLTMTGGVFQTRLHRFQVYDLHRFTSLLGLGFAVFHALIVLPDRYIGFALHELFLPLASPYRPLPMAVGVVSLYLTVLIVAAFYCRRLVSYRAWRLLHYTTVLAFALALAHGVSAGTDADVAWVQYLYAGTGLVAFNLLVYRALKGKTRGMATSTGAALVQSPPQSGGD